MASTAAIAPTTITQNSLLLNLIGELRNKIYAFAMPTNSAAYILAGARDDHDHPINAGAVCFYSHIKPYMFHARTPVIMQVCKQLRIECSSLYYESNTFRLDRSMSSFPHALAGFIAARGPAVQRIRRVEVNWHGEVRHVGRFDVTLVLEQRAGQVVFSGWSVKYKETADDKEEKEHALCSCRLQELVARPGTVMDVAEGFIESELVNSQSQSTGVVVDCKRCGGHSATGASDAW